MKTIAITILALCLAGPVFALGSREINEDYNLKGFSEIKNSTSIDIELSIGNRFSVSATGPEKYLDKLDIYTKGETLIVELRSKISWSGNSRNAVLYVTLPELQGIAQTGSGTIYVENNIKTDGFSIKSKGSGDIHLKNINSPHLTLKLTGSGEIDAGDLKADTVSIGMQGSGDFECRNLEAETVKLNISGSGEIDITDLQSEDLSISQSGSASIHLSGRVDSFDLNNAGSGDFNGKGLLAGRADVNLIGSGSANLSVSDNASVSLSLLGSGSITVYGDPKILSKSSLGPGDIHIRN